MTSAFVDRLLASDEPSIRFKTRVQVLGESPDSRRIRALRREIRDSPRARALLAERDGEGRIAPKRHPYFKFKGAHWVMATLADLGYPPGDRSLLPARDQLMDCWLAPRSYYTEFEVESKAASYRRQGVPVMQGRPRRCASQQSNALWSVMGLGLADERAEQLVERLLHWQWPDGGWNCDRNPAATHSSFMESLLPLRALARVDTPEARRAARRAAEIFLKRRLFRRESTGEVMRPGFLKLHYPRYWHYDVLGGLKVLAEAGFLSDPRCEEALDWLESKRLPDGGWPAEARFYVRSAREQSRIECVDWGRSSSKRSNEWVSVEALAVLSAAGRS
ncbi:MAG: hypothetical protein QNK05_10480 [Myxococcota bacterium]|nr:hypothetical protein [Myxococcota bacterium]